MIHDLPTYLNMRLANGDVVLDKSPLYIAPALRLKPDEK
jgi:hypothetical protein